MPSFEGLYPTAKTFDDVVPHMPKRLLSGIPLMVVQPSAYDGLYSSVVTLVIDNSNNDSDRRENFFMVFDQGSMLTFY